MKETAINFNMLYVSEPVYSPLFRTAYRMGQSSSASRPGESSGLRSEYETYRSLFSADEQDELQTVYTNICQHGGGGGGGGGGEKDAGPGQAPTSFTEAQFKVSQGPIA